LPVQFSQLHLDVEAFWCAAHIPQLRATRPSSIYPTFSPGDVTRRGADRSPHRWLPRRVPGAGGGAGLNTVEFSTANRGS
jgi:hypothetical protein